MFVAIGLVGVVLFLGLAVTNTLAMGVFAVPSVVVVFEGLRARVEVDLDREVVVSCRAFRRDLAQFADIVNVRVPPWGPVALTLRAGVRKPRGGLWPGQVLTGLYNDHRRNDGVASALAALLNVPVVSVWPRVRSSE